MPEHKRCPDCIISPQKSCPLCSGTGFVGVRPQPEPEAPTVSDFDFPISPDGVLLCELDDLAITEDSINDWELGFIADCCERLCIRGVELSGNQRRKAKEIRARYV